MSVTSIGGPDEPDDGPRALDIEQELRDIRAANGGKLTARAIVEAARPDDAPLHPKFEWNDAKAGERYRLQQARHLVRIVRLQYIDKRGEPDSIRVFHSVHKGGARSYEPLDVIETNQVMTQEIMRQMNVDWRAFKRRYIRFADFIAMIVRDLGLNEQTGTDPNGDDPNGTKPLSLDEPPDDGGSPDAG